MDKTTENELEVVHGGYFTLECANGELRRCSLGIDPISSTLGNTVAHIDEAIALLQRAKVEIADG